MRGFDFGTELIPPIAETAVNSDMFPSQKEEHIYENLIKDIDDIAS